jgi:hypothetical protein
MTPKKTKNNIIEDLVESEGDGAYVRRMRRMFNEHKVELRISKNN